MKKLEDFNSQDRIGVRLLENSVHFLIGEIDEENVNDTIKWLVYENLNPKSEKILTLYINSQGGDLYQAFGLIDMIRNSQMPVRTMGYGSIMSSAFLILASGTKGERYIAPNTGIMIHQFTASTEGKYHDIKAEMKENESLNRKMYEVLKEATELDGRTIKQKLLPASDVYMSAEEMIEFGAADHILSNQ